MKISYSVATVVFFLILYQDKKQFYLVTNKSFSFCQVNTSYAYVSRAKISVFCDDRS